jgi:hypothetical protein
MRPGISDDTVCVSRMCRARLNNAALSEQIYKNSYPYYSL